jgi:hypothetical protein
MGEDAGRSTESTVFPTDESLYGARSLFAGLRPARCIALSPMILFVGSIDAGSGDDGL